MCEDEIYRDTLDTRDSVKELHTKIDRLFTKSNTSLPAFKTCRWCGKVYFLQWIGEEPPRFCPFCGDTY